MRGAQPGTVAVGTLLPPAAVWAAAPGTGLPGPELLPSRLRLALQTTGFLLRLRAPGRHLGVPGRRKHGSLPGTMHARTSTPPPVRPGAGGPTSGPPADTSGRPPPPNLAPRSSGSGSTSLSPLATVSSSGTLTHLTGFLCFLALIIGSQQLTSTLRSWDRVNTMRETSSSLVKITKVRPRETDLSKVTLGVSC